MKINWGVGIFLFYGIFAASLFYQVYRSTQYDHSLVANDYYAKDIAYQQTLDRLNNSLALKNPLVIDYKAQQQQIELVFPNEFNSVSGSIWLYRASSQKEDIKLPIRMDENHRMTILTASLKEGKWKVEVEWTGDGEDFLDRKSIINS